MIANKTSANTIYLYLCIKTTPRDYIKKMWKKKEIQSNHTNYYKFVRVPHLGGPI